MAPAAHSPAPPLRGRPRRPRPVPERSPVNIRQLSYLCAAAQTGSFSRAARDAGVSVQAVSKALGELEEELGGALFSRGSTGSQLTVLGQALLPYAERAVAAYDTAASAAAELALGAPPRNQELDLSIVIATPFFGNYEQFCAGLARFFSTHLGCAVGVEVRPFAEARLGLAGGSYDVLVSVGRFEDPLCATKVVGRVSTAAFFARTHPLSGKKVVTLAELSAYPLVDAPSVTDFNRAVAGPYEQVGLASPYVQVKSDRDYQRALFKESAYSLGVGIAAFGTPGVAEMHLIDPREMLPVPICCSVMNDNESAHLERFNRFLGEKFSALLRMLSS